MAYPFHDRARPGTIHARLTPRCLTGGDGCIDFNGINQAALPQLPRLAAEWLPGGKRAGHEWRCGSLAGEPGTSLGVNLRTGKWCDFATGERGGDVVSLYAAIRRVSQAKAARTLATLLAAGRESGR